ARGAQAGPDEIHGVEEVEHLGPELELHVLADLDVLVESQVGLEEPGPVADTPFAVAESADDEPVERPGRRVEPLGLRRPADVAGLARDHVRPLVVALAGARSVAGKAVHA